MIEYSLGGHVCGRPQAVQQGQCDDKFEVKPDTENELLWRPTAIQTKNLKAANLASHFPYQILNDSALLIVPWNLFFFYMQVVPVKYGALQGTDLKRKRKVSRQWCNMLMMMTVVLMLVLVMVTDVLFFLFFLFFVDQVWRLRRYSTEKCVAAAKPLWYLPADLKLEKDVCKRLI